jgi:hypothetical protein
LNRFHEECGKYALIPDISAPHNRLALNHLNRSIYAKFQTRKQETERKQNLKI